MELDEIILFLYIFRGFWTSQTEAVLEIIPKLFYVGFEKISIAALQYNSIFPNWLFLLTVEIILNESYRDKNALY